MTVEPGFGGQKFMNKCLTKIEAVKKMLYDYKLSEVYLEVDGGINAETSKPAINAGANVLVAGSYVYNAPDIQEVISSLKKC